MNRVLLALALACVCSPAVAAGIGEIGREPVVIPFGDWIVAIANTASEVLKPILMPILVGAIVAGINKVAPWGMLLLSQQRIELMADAALNYGLNAVRGAAKGKTLSADQAREVIRVGTEYVTRAAPAKVVEAANGVQGIAQRVFRKLDLDGDGHVLNVLIPAVEDLERNVPAAQARGRTV